MQRIKKARKIGRFLRNKLAFCAVLLAAGTAFSALAAGQYNEPQRPQLHFTALQSALNDPNGLVYNAYTGEYNLFFQSDRPLPENPFAVEGNKKCWGHAVSYDLVNWEELPVAIQPDENGTIWSGSCVVDENNSSGLFPASTPKQARLVALYTYYGGSGTVGKKPDLGRCSVGIAYSLDNGRTFIKPFADPIIKNTNNQYQAMLRDPKVFWFADNTLAAGGEWVMVASDAQALLFTSPDLIHWKLNRRLLDASNRPLGSECPDLYPLPLDGDAKNMKWVYSGGGVFYVVGKLQRKADGLLDFTAQTGKLPTVNAISELWPGLSPVKAPELYAAQTFYNSADGSRLEVGWLRDQVSAANKPWIGTLSLTQKLGLKTINGQPRLTKYPVEGQASLRGERLLEIKNKTLSPNSTNWLAGLQETLFEINATFTPGSATEFGFYLRKNGGQYLRVAYYPKTKRLITDKNNTGGAPKGQYNTGVEPENGKITIRLLMDVSAMDIYANEGVAYHNGLHFCPAANKGMELYAIGGTVTVDALTVTRLNGMNRQAVSQGLRPTATTTATAAATEPAATTVATGTTSAAETAAGATGPLQMPTNMPPSGALATGTLPATKPAHPNNLFPLGFLLWALPVTIAAGAACWLVLRKRAKAKK